jgi:hypothetical protein
MIGVDAKSTSTTLNYEVFKIGRASEVTASAAGTVDMVHYATLDHMRQTQRLVSDLFLGRRVALDRDIELHHVRGTYTVFQPKPYDVEAARTAHGWYKHSWSLLASVLLLGFPWYSVLAALVLNVWAGVRASTALPNQYSEQVTHDADVEVPVEVAYYIDPTLPSPSTWQGPGYTKVTWDDGSEYYDPVAAFDAKVNWMERGPSGPLR